MYSNVDKQTLDSKVLPSSIPFNVDDVPNDVVRITDPDDWSSNSSIYPNNNISSEKWNNKLHRQTDALIA